MREVHCSCVLVSSIWISNCFIIMIVWALNLPNPFRVKASRHNRAEQSVLSVAWMLHCDAFAVKERFDRLLLAPPCLCWVYLVFLMTFCHFHIFTYVLLVDAYKALLLLIFVSFFSYRPNLVCWHRSNLLSAHLGMIRKVFVESGPI